MDLPRGEVLAALRTWLPAQRWFAGKGQAGGELRFAAITPLLGEVVDKMAAAYIMQGALDRLRRLEAGPA